MIYSILFVILAALSYWLYTTRVVPAEVALNARMIIENGSADNLRGGFHQRRSWVRVWQTLACCMVPALPLLLGEGVGGGVLAFLSMAALLGGYFARWFSPLLNVARGKAEYLASSDSASWPDAAVWKDARQAPAEMLPADRQEYADHLLEKLLKSVWLWCRIAAAALAAGAVVVAVNMN